MKVTVEERHDDWIAYVTGDKTRWEVGKSWSAAIGQLVISLGLVEVEVVQKSKN